MPLIYCFYVLLTIDFMVCASRKTFAKAIAWAQAERSEAWTQVND